MVAEKIKYYLSELPKNVTLVAVSKTKPEELIMEAYNAGHNIFGENKIQDLVRKYENMPKDINWHFIGHLQTNKIKYIVPFVSLIHAVDSFKLLKAINKEARKINKTINCLLQIHIADEDSKFGFSKNEINDLLNSKEYLDLQNINICGLMGMATFTEDNNKIANEFKYLSELKTELKDKYFSNNPDFKEISMGMSGDYKIAIEQGSTMVRIGSDIFGSRGY